MKKKGHTTQIQAGMICKKLDHLAATFLLLKHLIGGSTDGLLDFIDANLPAGVPSKIKTKVDVLGLMENFCAGIGEQLLTLGKRISSADLDDPDAWQDINMDFCGLYGCVQFMHTFDGGDSDSTTSRFVSFCVYAAQRADELFAAWGEMEPSGPRLSAVP